jgi:hypothetical protein
MLPFGHSNRSRTSKPQPRIEASWLCPKWWAQRSSENGQWWHYQWILHAGVYREASDGSNPPGRRFWKWHSGTPSEAAIWSPTASILPSATTNITLHFAKHTQRKEIDREREREKERISRRIKKKMYKWREIPSLTFCKASNRGFWPFFFNFLPA